MTVWGTRSLDGAPESEFEPFFQWGDGAPVTPPLAPAHGSTDDRLSEPAAGEDEPRRARAAPPRQPPRRDDEVDAEAPERRLESYRVRPDLDV